MSENNEIPARVQAAMNFLEHCRYIEESCGFACSARSLRPDERTVSRAALDVLRLYLTGEMDYAPPGRADPEETQAGSEPASGAD